MEVTPFFSPSSLCLAPALRHIYHHLLNPFLSWPLVWDRAHGHMCLHRDMMKGEQVAPGVSHHCDGESQAEIREGLLALSMSVGGD